MLAAGLAADRRRVSQSRIRFPRRGIPTADPCMKSRTCEREAGSIVFSTGFFQGVILAGLCW